MVDMPTMPTDWIQQLRGIFFAKDRSPILERFNWLGIPLISTPSVNPNGGWHHVYLKEDSNLYGLDSAGNEFLLASNLPGDTTKVSQLYDSDFDITALSADSDGYLSTSVQPIFSATNTVDDANVTGDGTTYTVIFDTELFDKNANYNNATGTFTAPVTGRYLIVAAVRLEDLGAAHTSGYIVINTSNRNWFLNYVNPVASSFSGGFYTMQGAVITDMDTNDTCNIQIFVSGGAKTVGVSGNPAANATNIFSGYLLI